MKAARKQGDAAAASCAYVVTTRRPRARRTQLTAPPDHEHYVTQQLKPIADAVLRFVDGPDFDDLSGARKQLSLF